jgi:hypothetical protein
MRDFGCSVRLKITYTALSARTGRCTRTRTVNQGGIDRRVDCIWEDQFVETLQVCLVRVLTQIARDPDRVLARRNWGIVRVVELLEARDRDNVGTVQAKVRIRIWGTRGGGARLSTGRANRNGDVENLREYNANVANSESGTHRLGAAKVRRGLHEFDVRV